MRIRIHNTVYLYRKVPRIVHLMPFLQLPKTLKQKEDGFGSRYGSEALNSCSRTWLRGNPNPLTNLDYRRKESETYQKVTKCFLHFFPTWSFLDPHFHGRSGHNDDKTGQCCGSASTVLLCGSGSGIQEMFIWIRILGGRLKKKNYTQKNFN